MKNAGLGAVALGAVASCGGNPDKKDGTTHGNAVAGNVPVRGEDGIGLLGFGCMRFPMEGDVIDQEAVNAMVDKALEHGVNYFDTSPVYLKGKSEEATAAALRRHPRESYFLATKLSVWDGTPEEYFAMYRRSFEIFQTDYFDYYLLHSVKDVHNFNSRYLNTGVMDFLLEERKAGRIRHLGFSFHGDAKGFDSLMALHEKYHWDFVQIQMNYVDWNYPAKRNTKASYLYAELEKRGIPVVIMEPLLGGRLADVPAAVLDRMKEREPSLSAASWSLRFCASYPGVLTVLSGMSRMEHLEDNLRTFTDFKPLEPSDYPFLEEIARNMNSFSIVRCTSCQYCMPCPYGIDIPGIFKFYNDRINEGTYITGKDQKDYYRARRRYLLKYDKAVESVRQADHCISCGRCVDACPQHIKIPRELARIDDYIEKLKRETL